MAELCAAGLDPVAEEGGAAVEIASDRLRSLVSRSRVASRVLVRVASGGWRDPAAISRLLSELPWAWWPHRGPLDVRWAVHGVRSEQGAWLRHEVDRQLQPYATSAAGGESLALLFRVEGARLQVSADASGRAMHLRGWRTEQGEAPLRETIAAALLLAVGYDGSQTLWDPMCGSGTIAIEAATWQLPAHWRPWAVDGWALDGGQDAHSAMASGASSPEIVAGDLDPAVVEVARRNAERAGVPDRITWIQAEIGAQRGDRAAPQCVVVNPPWGHRLGKRNEVRRLFERLGAVLVRDAAGARAAVLAPEPQLARELPLLEAQVTPLDCGGITLWLATGTISYRSGPPAKQRSAGRRP